MSKQPLSPVAIMGKHLRAAAEANYDKTMFEIWTAAMEEYASSQLVEAEERIKTLEAGIKRVISTLNWIENGDEIEILRKALSTNNKQK